MRVVCAHANGPCGALQTWVQCKGSSPNSRGYTCGLWLLFHSLAARTPADTGGAFWMAAIRGFVQVLLPSFVSLLLYYVPRFCECHCTCDHTNCCQIRTVLFAQNFFPCSECAKHFLQVADSSIARKVRSRRDAVLWLWHTHNLVGLARSAVIAIQCVLAICGLTHLMHDMLPS